MNWRRWLFGRRTIDPEAGDRMVLKELRRFDDRSAGDRAVLDQLREVSVDLSQPHEVTHYLYLPSREASKQAAEALRARGFVVQEEMAADAAENPPNPFFVRATAKAVLTDQGVQEARQVLEELAEFHNGEYDGWEAAAKL